MRPENIDNRSIWPVEHPLHKWAEDVKALARQHHLRIVDAVHRGKLDPKRLATDAPKLTRKKVQPSLVDKLARAMAQPSGSMKDGTAMQAQADAKAVLLAAQVEADRVKKAALADAAAAVEAAGKQAQAIIDQATAAAKKAGK